MPQEVGYATPARYGWGQTAQSLYPKLANIGKLGPLGGRLDQQPEEDKKAKSKKVPTVKIEDFQDEDDDSNYFSNLDLLLYIGFFLFAAGLVVMILVLPLPNIWVLNEDMIYVAVGVLLLGVTIFIGSILPCLMNYLWRLICCQKKKGELKKSEKKGPIQVVPTYHDSDVEELIAAVYVHRHLDKE